MKNNKNTISHEELCAYVFGEADAELSARVANALEGDEALRAEHGALTATIGLVKSSCTVAEALSPQMLDNLEAAARPAPQVNPWYTSTPIRMAAGIAVLAAGVLGGRAMMEREPDAEPTQLARLESVPASARVAGAEDKQELVDKALLGARAPEPVKAPSLTAPGSASIGGLQSVEEAFGKSELKELREAPEVKEGYGIGVDFGSQSVLELTDVYGRGSTAAISDGGTVTLNGLGYADSTAEAISHTDTLGTSRVSVAGEQDGWAANSRAAENLLGAGGGFYGEAGDSFFGRGDDFFLGHGQRTQVSGPSGPSAHGPSSPGPSAPSAPVGRFGGRRGLPRAKSGGDRWRLSSGDDEDLARHYGGDLDRDSASQDLRANLTPAQVDELCKQRVERILQSCRRYPNERPRAMFFRYWGDNAFELTRLDNLSTFSADVDTASYTLARRYLADGTLPEKAQIRTEEFVNYFKPDVAAPTEGTFAVHTDLAPSRFGVDDHSVNQRYMLRVVVRGREVAASERKPLALTFVIDTSGSMKEDGRLELVKHSLRLLMAQLDARDSLAIVAFSSEARLVLPMTSAANRGLIESALYGLHPAGGTNAESGLKMGYEVAQSVLSSEAHNRVVLLSDGVANIGQTDQDRLNSDVKARRDAGIFLNTIGVGMANHNDAFLEQLADKGDGLCNYIDSAVEARRALVENFTGAFEPIARDVKIQVVFDKDQVSRYRLLGYENRAIADADFRNDAVDAGEVGAGHQVVALYELELTGKASDAALAQVNLRWKAPTGVGRDPLEDSATERSFQVSAEQLTTWEGASDGYKRSVLVAQFAEILRRSVHARGDSLDELIADSLKLATQLKDPDFDELVAMLQKSRELIIKHTPRRDTLTLCIDSIRRNHILRAQYKELRQTQNQTVLAELERQNQELEQRIEELIRGELEAQVK